MTRPAAGVAGLFCAAVAVASSPAYADRLAVRTAPDAVRLRAQLQRHIWGPTGLPLTKQPARIARGASYPPFSRLANLRRIDRLTIPITLGFESAVLHLLPEKANGRMLVYHNGHGEPLSAGKSTVAYFLRRGYAVFVLAMPLAGANRYPPFLPTPCGLVRLAKGLDNPFGLHEGLSCMTRPHRLFVEPVVAVLNYARRFRFRSTAMVGLSGGGWTTVLAAAADDRIARSYPVAGTLPKVVTDRDCRRSRDPLCRGDFEQRDPGLYRVASYFELYALGAWGTGRRQLAIYNVYDPCCFSGASFRRWKLPVQRAMRMLGSGWYDARGDASHHRHAISRQALAMIGADLAR